jgi:hypothetical protein
MPAVVAAVAAVVWWQWQWRQLGGNMVADMAAWSWQQPSGGGSVAAVVWQHWGGSGSTAAVVAALVPSEEQNFDLAKLIFIRVRYVHADPINFIS